MKKHPFDRSTSFDRWLRQLHALLQDSRTWRRHPAPFAKTPRGKARRTARRFRLETKNHHLYLDLERNQNV